MADEHDEQAQDPTPEDPASDANPDANAGAAPEAEDTADSDQSNSDNADILAAAKQAMAMMSESDGGLVEPAADVPSEPGPADQATSQTVSDGRVGAMGPRAVGSPSGFEAPELMVDGPSFETVQPEAIEMLSDVDLDVSIALGGTMMYIEDVLRLSEGSVIELDKLAGDPVDIIVNGRHIARGEVLVLNDNFCVRVSEIMVPTDDAERQAS